MDELKSELNEIGGGRWMGRVSERERTMVEKMNNLGVGVNENVSGFGLPQGVLTQAVALDFEPLGAECAVNSVGPLTPQMVD